MRRKKLSEVNPGGRLDVLAYRVIERVCKLGGIEGIFKMVEPDIERLIRRNVTGKKVVMPEHFYGDKGGLQNFPGSKGGLQK